MDYLKRKILLGLPPIEFKPNHIYQIKGVYRGEAIKEKEKVLKYLTLFYPNFSSSGKIYDSVINKEIEHTCNLGYFDGVYFWNDADTYYIKKYDMPLKPEFIEHAVKKLSEICKE